MKLLIPLLAALVLVSCTREDYRSSAESFFKDREVFQLRSPDEFLVREEDGSVYLYNVEVTGGNGVQRIESRITVFGPDSGFRVRGEKRVDPVPES